MEYQISMDFGSLYSDRFRTSSASVVNKDLKRFVLFPFELNFVLARLRIYINYYDFICHFRFICWCFSDEKTFVPQESQIAER